MLQGEQLCSSRLLGIWVVCLCLFGVPRGTAALLIPAPTPQPPVHPTFPLSLLFPSLLLPPGFKGYLWEGTLPCLCLVLPPFLFPILPGQDSRDLVAEQEESNAAPPCTWRGRWNNGCFPLNNYRGHSPLVLLRVHLTQASDSPARKGWG